MRSWPGLAAVGAGLIHLGIAAGSPALQLVGFAAAGALEVAWGVLVLARPDAARPRAALGGAAALVALQVVVLLAGGHAHDAASTAGPHDLPTGAVAGATLLDLAAAVLMAVRIRRGSDGTGSGGPFSFLLETASAAAIVAAITVASLAGTAVGAAHGGH